MLFFQVNRAFFFLLFALQLLIFQISSSEAAPDASFYLGGIQVNEPDHQHWIKTLKKSGMNTVSVTVYAHQGDWDSDNLWFEVSDTNVLGEIRVAKQHGVKVVLILRVALDHAFSRNRFLWHGMIMPKSDALVEAWFSRYRKFVLAWTRIAATEQVDVLGIGSELNALTSTLPTKEVPALEEYYLNSAKQEQRKKQMLAHAEKVESHHLWTRGTGNATTFEEYVDAQRRAQETWAKQVSAYGFAARVERINSRRSLLQKKWIELIKEVRTLFRGKLSYAANFDQFQNVGFWNELDLIGINSYFKLREGLPVELSQEQLSAALLDGWRGVFAEIQSFRSNTGLENKPVLFTEIGFTFRKHCSIEPWAGEGFSLVETESGAELVVWKEQPLDFMERALVFKSLRNVVSELPQGVFSGFLYWKLSTIKSHLDIEPFVHIIGKDGEPLLQKELVPFIQ